MKRTQTVPFILVAITSLARPALGQQPPAAGAAPPAAAAPAVRLSSITGVAIDPTSNTPVAGVAVTLSSASLAGGEKTAVTDAKGVYTLSDLPAGSYEVRFKKAQFKQLTKDVALEGGKTLTADVELVPEEPAAAPGAATRGSSTVTGVAIDTVTKKPLADVVVTLASPLLPGGEQIELTDATGAYTFNNVPAGSYKVRFDRPAFKPLSKTITVTSGKGVTNVEMLADQMLAEEIVVTGTRIPRLSVDTAAPVTTVIRAQIQSSGRTSVGDILQTLPEQTGGINTQVNNPGDGSTRINLRGFGTNRTLVLLNGRRMVAGGTGASSTVDLNTIPAAAIERIEILKDGASAIYGSDAVTGVVNIITRSDYNATEISGFTGISQHGDGRIFDVSFTTGRTVERGGLIFSAGFYNQTEVWARNRDFSYFDYGIAGYNWASAKMLTGGSSSIPNGRFGKPKGMGNDAWQAVLNDPQNQGATNFTYDPTLGKMRKFNGSGVTEAGGDYYNYQPVNYLVTPQTRLNLFSTGWYRLIGSSQAYYEALYTHRESAQLLAPEPLFTDEEGLTVSKDNYYNKYGLDFDTVRRRLVEFGGRTTNQDVDTFRVVTGIKGNFLPKWTWDVSANYGRTQGTNLKSGNLQRSKLAAAVGPSFVGDDGKPHCGTDQMHEVVGCVPLDLFHGAGSITPEQRDYLTYRGTARSYIQQIVLSAATAGELVKIPSAPSPIGFAAGYEHRREAATDIQDPLTDQGDTTGNKVSSTQGSYYVNEAFLELSIPILSRFGSFAGSGTLLELNAAGRYVNYSSFGSNFTYKGGARISPLKDVTLRGTYSTAFRAPTIAELFLGAADAFPDSRDPCANRTPGTALDTACNNQGVSKDDKDDRGQLITRIGGNSKLKPETAKSFTIGAVFEPRWVKNLELTVDYYNIEVTNAITPLGAAVILASCYPKQAGVTANYCDRIHRDADGLIQRIDNPLTNVGGDHLSGIDFQVDYSQETPIGALGFRVNTNYLGFFDRTLGDGTVIHAKGTYDLSLVLPDWRGNVTVSYGNRGFSGALTVRWLDGFRECENNSCRQTDPTQPPPRTRNVDAYAAADLNLGYKLSHPGGSATNFGVGMNNLFNATPPYIVNGPSAASDPTAYDYMGRYIYVRLSHEIK